MIGMFVSKEVLHAGLSDHAEALFREAFGEPQRVGAAEWRNSGGGSKAMRMTGPDRGLWHDFKAGQGGDLFDLAAIEWCGLDRAKDDFPRVCAVVANRIGLNGPDDLADVAPPLPQSAGLRTRPDDAAQKAEQKQREVDRNRAASEPVTGTPAAVYLAGRGIDTVPDTVRYLPKGAAASWEAAALVVFGTDDEGRVRGGHKVYLTASGQRGLGQKATGTPGKRSFGTIKGYPARFAARNAAPAEDQGGVQVGAQVGALVEDRITEGPLCVAEGTETALSIWLATGYETWAVFGVGFFAAAPLPLGRKVVLCPDQDAASSPARTSFETAVAKHVARGAEVWIAEAPEPEGSKADLNDTLQRAGPEAVRQAIESASEVPRGLVLPVPAPLRDGRRSTLEAALREATADAGLAVAVAVADVLQRTVPVQRSVDQVITFIERHAPPRALGTDALVALRHRIARNVAARTDRALARSALPADMRNRHDVETRAGLDGLDAAAFEGVVVLRAPMGTGKTQKVGKPLALAAREAGQPIMAICPRQSLTGELARRLGLTDYREATVEGARGGVAVCLPSILRPDIVEALPAPAVLFIDEIVQVLQFLTDPTCSSSGGPHWAVFERLQQIVGRARVVVVADAHVDATTLEFLEACRPGERFRIIEVTPKRRSKTGVVHDRAGAVLDLIAVELAGGGRVWLSCEGRGTAESAAQRYRDAGARVLCVTAHTKGDPEVQAFLADPETQARAYDLIVSSPAISSGLSIEHTGAPHFTSGAYIGSGIVTTPEDAMQQLGRVRYLERFDLALERSNLPVGTTVAALRIGIEGAARIERLELDWTRFDTLLTTVAAMRDCARAEFAAGLWWLLERDGWTVTRARTAAPRGPTSAAKIWRANRIEALRTALPLTRHMAGLLRAMRDRNSEQEIRLEAHEMRLEFGLLEVGPDLAAHWDGGQCVEVRERFEDLVHADPSLPDESGRPLSSREFRAARRALYAGLFDGTDWRGPITDAAAETILDRIMARPEVFAAVGIVAAKFRSRGFDAQGSPRAPDRPKRPRAEVAQILKRAGLRTTSELTRLAPDSILREPQVSQPGRKDGRVTVLCIVPGSLEQMQAWQARRRDFDIDTALAARAEALRDGARTEQDDQVPAPAAVPAGPCRHRSEGSFFLGDSEGSFFLRVPEGSLFLGDAEGSLFLEGSEGSADLLRPAGSLPPAEGSGGRAVRFQSLPGRARPQARGPPRPTAT